uniref:Si:ch211-191d15.2 n=1 Tax=Gouania willdenowi TaxID=441366 RepID=A0A8C5END4_GOUWI
STPCILKLIMLHTRCAFLLVLYICPLAYLEVYFCPSYCCCFHPELLVLCESLGLRSVPGSIPLSTSALSMARNQLCDVDQQLRPFSMLLQLSLGHNLLTRFPRGLPPSLESLLLHNNRITYITSGVLRPLGNLKRLYLEHNDIRAFQPGALHGLHQLQILSLKGNQLTSLPLHLPSSLNLLDVSANCISVLDVASLTPLWNLQVLKINSNCLRLISEGAFDWLPRLISVDLSDNLWLCQCDIMYLYRWMLSSPVRMATTDLECTEPAHLAHRLLLNLSVLTICPQFQKPNHRMQGGDLSYVLEERRAAKAMMQNSEESQQKTSNQTSSEGENIQESRRTGMLHYSLETLTYEQCLSLNKTQSVPPFIFKTATPLPEECQRCRENTTAGSPPNRTTRFPLSTNVPRVEPYEFPQHDSPVVIALLAVLCVLVALLMLAVLIVLKKLLLHRQRVAPINVLPAR